MNVVGQSVASIMPVMDSGLGISAIKSAAKSWPNHSKLRRLAAWRSLHRRIHLLDAAMTAMTGRSSKLGQLKCTRGDLQEPSEAKGKDREER